MNRFRYPGIIVVLCAALSLLVFQVSAVEAGKGKKTKKPRTEDIINVFLGLDYSQWLVGPTYYIATEEERAQYLALTSDQEAEVFIKEFWKRRDPEPDIFGNPALDLFKRRAELADRQYRERAVLGRRTDRGAIYVLFGEPEEILFDGGRGVRDPDLEIWTYGAGTESFGALQPSKRYYFAEVDGQTVLYTPRPNRRIDLGR